jgi:hypothetical protein
MKTRRALENSALLRKPGPTGQSPSKIHGPVPATLVKSLDRPKSKPKGPRKIVPFKGGKREKSASNELLNEMKITDMATDSSIDSQYSLADWSFSKVKGKRVFTIYQFFSKQQISVFTRI